MPLPLPPRRAGDFGLLQPRYAIEDGRIVLTQGRWHLALGALLLPLGLGSLFHVFTQPSFFTYIWGDTGSWFVGAGITCVSTGLAQVWTALGPSRRVEITRGRVRWGRRELAASEFDDVSLRRRFVEKGGHFSPGLQYHWDLLLKMKDGQQLRMLLCRTPSDVPPEAAWEVAQLARKLLGLQPVAHPRQESELSQGAPSLRVR